MKWVMIAMYLAAQSGEVVEKQMMDSYTSLELCLAHLHDKEFTYQPLPEGANAVVFYCEEIQQ